MAENQLDINILVAGRPYKLKVEPGEEGLVRQVAKNINDKVQDYQQQFFSKDKQDFLAMIALQTGVELLKNKKSDDLPANDPELEQKLDALNTLLDQHLKKEVKQPL